MSVSLFLTADITARHELDRIEFLLYRKCVKAYCFLVSIDAVAHDCSLVRIKIMKKLILVVLTPQSKSLDFGKKTLVTAYCGI